MLERFSRSKVKGQGRDRTECYDGGGMHFDDVGVESHSFVLAFELRFFFLSQKLVNTDKRK